jgi:hypothetical protein
MSVESCGWSSSLPRSGYTASLVVALVVLTYMLEVLVSLFLVSFVVLACRDEDAAEQAVLPFSVRVEDLAETLWVAKNRQ